jgi:hypothetical protein
MDAPEAIAERVRHLEMKVNKLANPASLYKSTLFEDREVARRLAHLDLITHGWDDLERPLTGAKITSPSSHVVYDVAEGAMKFQKTCTYDEDYVETTIQLQHKVRVGSIIYPHIHWWQSASAMPNWLLAYRWQVQGAAKTTAWTEIGHSANVSTWSTGVLNQITKFDHIDAPTSPAAGLSDCVQFRIYRDTAGESTAWTGKGEVDDNVQDDAYVVSFDIHVQVDAAGSYGEYTK